MMRSDLNNTFTLDSKAIANFVKLQRLFLGWKQETLASMAGVSLATVQRVERGVRVRPAQLRKLAVALHQPADTFTKERPRPTPIEVEQNLASMFSWAEGRVPVSVAPFKTERQLRALLTTDALLFTSDLEQKADNDLAELREWLDLAGFIQAERSGLIGPEPGRDLKVRRLWRDILDCVERLQRSYRAVILTGVYDAEPTYGREPITIGAVAVRSLEKNPAASKISTLWADAKVDETQMHYDALDGNE